LGSIKQAFDLSERPHFHTGGSRGSDWFRSRRRFAAGIQSSRRRADLRQAQEHLAGLGIKSVGSPPQCQGGWTSAGLRMMQSTNWARSTFWSNNAGRELGRIHGDHPIEAWYKLMTLTAYPFFCSASGSGTLSMHADQIRPHHQSSTRLPAFVRQRRYANDRLSHHKAHGEFHSRALAAIGDADVSVQRACKPGFFPCENDECTLRRLARTACGECSCCVVSATRTIFLKVRGLVRKRCRQTLTGRILLASRRWLDRRLGRLPS